MGWSVWAERGKHPRARMGEVQSLAEGGHAEVWFPHPARSQPRR